MKSFISFLVVILFALNAHGQCNPLFSANATALNNNLLQGHFTNLTNYTPSGNLHVFYTLKFGDGQQVALTYGSATHDYAAPGTYTVWLVMRVVDSSTLTTICLDSVSHPLVMNYMPCSFTFAETIGSGGSVTFTATAPVPNPNAVYTWHFGDNTTATGNPVTHVYGSNGTYAVWVSSFGGGACSYSNNHDVVVSNTSSICSGHLAYYSSNIVNYDVSFYDASAGFWGQTKVSTWNFGDGSTGTGNAVTHHYAAIGNYNVTLNTDWVDSITNALICNSVYTNSIYITGNNIPNVIAGNVSADSTSPFPDTFKVWLINYNPSTSILTAVDSQVVTGNNGYAFYGEPAGTYLTKAKLLNTLTTLTGPVPTYYGSSLYWNTATNIVHTAASATGRNIHLLNGVVTSGPGFIGGNVNMGANKGTGGAAVPGMQIILRDVNNAPVQCAYTDINGDYSFSNLPLGTYSIYPEEMNYATTPYTSVELTATSPSKSGFVFGLVNGNEIRPKNTAVAEIPDVEELNIHPNPSNGKFFINWSKAVADYTITVTDLTGHLVYKGEGKSGNTVQELSLQGLQTGMYFIKLENNKLNVTQKLIIQR